MGVITVKVRRSYSFVMQQKSLKISGRLFWSVLILAAAQFAGTSILFAQAPIPGAPGTVTAPTPALLELLQWDSILKEASPQPGQAEQAFTFKVTNPSEQNIVIDHVQTSCGCTVAKLPSQPWILTPHTNGEIDVKVNLAGKSGTVWKTITVFSTNAQKVLTVKLNMPEDPTMVRNRNTMLAQADPQAIFKGDCAKCHVDKSKGLLGKALYKEACGICHEAQHRATMVPDLHALNHPTDYAFWKQIITEGKPKTLMPAFSDKHGGPLTDEQVESLARVLTRAFSSGDSNPQASIPAAKTSSASDFLQRIPPPQPAHN